MIELKGISRVYKPKKGEPVRALDNVDLSIGETGMVFILGKSGSGKSTLLNVIGGLDIYDSGELIIQGKSSKDFKQSDFDSYRNTMIGFIFQEYNILDDFTVAQNIGLALELQGQKATSERLNEILEAVDLGGYGARKPNELSGGQKQRVAIARALVKDPKIIMADEPTGALDSETGTQVLQTLKKLSKTRLVIVVSHDRDFADEYGSRIVEFKDGQIIRDVSKYQEESYSGEESAITFNNDGFSISAGYQLTTEDLRVINEYLAKSKNEVQASTHVEQTAYTNGEATFVQTIQNAIKMSGETYQPIRSKMPFRASLKMGASALKHKRVRLVFSIILASISLALFGLADTLGSYNKYDATVSSLRDSEVDYLSFSASGKIEDNDYSYYVEMLMSDEHLKPLNEISDTITFQPIIGASKYSGNSDRFAYYQNIGNNGGDRASAILIPNSAGFMEFKNNTNASFDLKYFGPTPTLPLGVNDIIITKYIYDVFRQYDYRDIETDTTITIESPQDLINKSIKLNGEYYRIVGIVDTGVNLERFEVLNSPTTDFSIGTMLLHNEFQNLMNYSYHNVFFISKERFENLKINVFSNNFNMSYRNDGFDNYIHSFYERNSLPSENVVYAKNKTASQLTDKDILINAIAFAAIQKEFLAGKVEETDVIEELYSRRSIEEIRFEAVKHQGEENVKPISEWDEDDKTNYGNMYLNTYYRLHDEIRLNLEIAFMNDLNAFDITLTSTTYNSQGQEQKTNHTFNVVGVYNYSASDSSYDATMAISRETGENLKFRLEGPYTSAIAPILNNSNDVLKKYAVFHFDNDGSVHYSMRNAVMATLDNVNSLIEVLSQVFLYIGIGFAVFASLLLLNFIGTSVSYKKQEIGILRAIGARGKDVLSIFSKEALIIAFINYVIAMTGVIIATILLNNLLREQYGLLITILNLGIRQFLLVLAVSIGVAYISSAIPVFRIARKRPIDAIRDK